MIRFFGGAKPNLKLATQDANAVVAHYGARTAYDEARRRCADPKFTFQDDSGHWERVTDILARRTGRTNRTVVVNLEIPQDHIQYVTLGQRVEITFKNYPGEVYTGRVESMQKPVAIAQPDSLAAPDIPSSAFLVRIKLEDQEGTDRLLPGGTGLTAIFDHVKAGDVTRQVVLRQRATLNYVN